MAGLTWDVDTELSRFTNLYKQFPSLGLRVLSFIGKHGRLYLKDTILEGDIGVRRYTTTKTGMLPVMSYASKTYSRLSFWSYPTNMYKRKKLLTGKFQTILGSKMSRLASIAERKIMDEELAKV